MSLYRKLSSKPKLFLSVAGISLSDFQRLLPDFADTFRQLESERQRRTVQTQAERQRAIGGGSQCLLISCPTNFSCSCSTIVSI